MPRIIAGTAKGRNLRVPESARPTSDRIKEAIFSSLGYMSGANVADLYGGSGALALEAISRGAEQAYIFENNKKAVQVIRDNVELLGFSKQVKVIPSAVEVATNKAGSEPFDFIFADPPYNYKLPKISRALDGLYQQGVINGDTILILERQSRDPGELPRGWDLTKERSYGETLIRYCQFSNNLEEK